LCTTPSASGANEVPHRVGVHVHHVADEAYVHRLTVDGGGAPGGGEQLGVLPGQAHGMRAVGVDQPNELAAYLAEQHHPHHVHHLGRGDPQPTPELPRQPEPAEHRGDLGSAAVHHDGVDACGAQEHHVLGERLLEPVVDHGVAAVLHDHDLAVEALQPREGLGEHPGLLRGGDQPLGGGHEL